MKSECLQLGAKEEDIFVLPLDVSALDAMAAKVERAHSQFGRMDKDIETGMDADEAAKKIVKGWHKGKLEIPVGKGIEMHALWIKRLLPKLMHKIAAKKAAPV